MRDIDEALRFCFNFHKWRRKKKAVTRAQEPARPGHVLTEDGISLQSKSAISEPSVDSVAAFIYRYWPLQKWPIFLNSNASSQVV